jgi:hypothetical protein
MPIKLKNAQIVLESTQAIKGTDNIPSFEKVYESEFDSISDINPVEEQVEEIERYEEDEFEPFSAASEPKIIKTKPSTSNNNLSKEIDNYLLRASSKSLKPASTTVNVTKQKVAWQAVIG